MQNRGNQEVNSDTSKCTRIKKNDCMFCEEVRRIPKGVEIVSKLFVLKSPDHPYTEELLELANLAGIPIPSQLGRIIIQMLTENVHGTGIRSVLHRILQNCETKRIPQGKVDGHHSSVNKNNNANVNHSVNGNHNCIDSAFSYNNCSGNGDCDCDKLTASYSKATKYLIENSVGFMNSALPHHINEQEYEEMMLTKDCPYLKLMSITGCHL